MSHAPTPTSPLPERARSAGNTSFHDLHVVTIGRLELSADEIFLRVFVHLPRWLDWVLRKRGAVAGTLPPHAAGLRAGERAGVWEIRRVTPREVVATMGGGLLLSLYKRSSSEIVITTLVGTDTVTGRIYLLLARLLRKPVAAAMMLRQVAAGRL